MFRAKTVLVLGAGASAEVGLPTGPKLLNEIVRLLDIRFEYNRQISGDHFIIEALKIILNEGRQVEKINEHLKACRQLRTSSEQALSIDNVIDALEDPKIELVGKIGIVKAILQSEASSNKFKQIENYPDTLNISNFKGTWYNHLTKLLTEQVRKSQINNIFHNLEIINFNYDRCLEHYLPHSLAAYYGLDINHVRNIMPSLKIHRPYGIVGKLPWQEGEIADTPFGESSPQKMTELVQQIRTFTERVGEETELTAIRETIANADRIVFLGFAFHRQNLELLSQHVKKHTEIIATAYQISDSDQLVIADELDKNFNLKITMNDDPRVKLADMTCNDFFQNYWRTLTASKGDYEPIDLSQSITSNFNIPRLDFPK